MALIFVDTNVFGALLNKNSPDLFQAFEQLLKKTAPEPHQFILTHYNVLERLGPSLPKLNISIPNPVPQYPQNQESVSLFGQQTCNTLFFLREEANKHYSKYISPKILEDRYLDQVKNFWKNDSIAKVWLDKLLPVKTQFNALSKDLIDLLAVDFQNGYSQLPRQIDGPVQAMNALSILVEYLMPRNIILGRLFKKMWLDRISSHSSLSESTLDKCHDSMVFKNSADFVDLEIIYLSIVGYYTNNKYHPIVSFTCDPAEKIKRRLYIVKSIIDALNADVFSIRQERISYNFGCIYVLDKNLNIIEAIRPDNLTRNDIV